MKVSKLTLMAAAMLLAGTLFAGDGEGQARERKGRGGAKEGQGMERGGRRGGGMMMMKDLDLTEEQKTQLKEVHEKNREQMKKLGEAVREAQKALREGAEADDVTEAKIKELAQKFADATAAMTLLQAQMKKEVGAVLTEEQKTKMAEKKKEMQAKMEERRKQMQERMQKRRGGKEGEDGKERRKKHGEEEPPPPPPAED